MCACLGFTGDVKNRALEPQHIHRIQLRPQATGQSTICALVMSWQALLYPLAHLPARWKSWLLIWMRSPSPCPPISYNGRCESFLSKENTNTRMTLPPKPFPLPSIQFQTTAHPFSPWLWPHSSSSRGSELLGGNIRSPTTSPAPQNRAYSAPLPCS